MMAAAMVKPQAVDRRGGALELHRKATFGEVSILPLQPPAPVNTTIDGVERPSALSYLILGGPAHLPQRRGRGGAHNSATRESDGLSAAQVVNLIGAAEHAAAIGLGFTRMITIHWKAAGVPLTGMAKATGRFIDLMSKALRRHGVEPAWIWVHENGPGKGWHGHILAFVPSGVVKALTGLQRGWLKRITGNTYGAGVIDSRPIGGRLGLEVSNPALHAENLKTVLAYLLKGASAQAADRVGLELLEPGGRIIGKRCGTSQNIGAKARRTRT